MAANKLIFQSAEKARDAIQASQQKEIAALYEKWAKQIGAKAATFATKKNASAPVSEMQMRELEKMLQKAGEQVTKEVNGVITKNIYSSANVVAESNAEWLKSLGFDGDAVSAAFSNVPVNVVQNIVTGQIYEGGWNLSQAIWGNNQQILKDAYGVVAAGVAQNMSAYEIAKLLEEYVSPSAKKPWNLKAPDGKKIYKKQVDYNAQRLARTLVQHSYQQSFIATTKENPLVTDYIWDANGSRVCPICKARHGKHFPKDKLPMDHPNGMCVMVPNTPSYNDMADKLADWVKGKEDPALDKFASKLGFDIPEGGNKFTPEQEKYLGKYGFSPSNMPKDFNDWSYKVSWDDASEILESMGTSWGDPHPYQQLQKYYNKYLVPAKVQAKQAAVPGATTKGIATGADFAAKYGTSSGAKFNYWYTKLDPDAKEIAKKLKDESGQTWQEWYEANIYKAKAGASKKKPTATKAKQNQQTPVANVSTDGWIGRAKKQTESYMLSTEAENFAAMNDAQVKGLKRYTGSSYTEMNGYLRYMAGGLSQEEAMDRSGISDSQYTDMIRAMKGLKTVASKEEFVLRRGTDLGDLAGLMQGNFMDNKRKLNSMSVDELNNLFAGHVGTYAGFTSTSCIWDRGFTGSVEVVMRAPVGTQGTSVMSISQYGTGEGEFLLNAGTKVRVIKVEDSDGHMGSSIRVYMEILP